MRTFLLLALSLYLVAPSALAAQNVADDANGITGRLAPQSAVGILLQHHQQLDLSEPQLRQLITVQQRLEQRNQPLLERLRELQDERRTLQRELAVGGARRPSEERRLAGEEQKVRAELETRDTAAIGEVRTLLTAEQQARAETLLERARSRERGPASRERP